LSKGKQWISSNRKYLSSVVAEDCFVSVVTILTLVLDITRPDIPKRTIGELPEPE
jgi:hypothetical protein